MNRSAKVWSNTCPRFGLRGWETWTVLMGVLLLAGPPARGSRAHAAAPPAAACGPADPDPTRAPGLSAEATVALVGRLRLSEHAEELDHTRLLADESWDDLEHPSRSDVETDEVLFYHSVHMESMQTEKGQPLGAAAIAHQQTAERTLERKVNAIWSGDAVAGRLVNLDGEIWSLPQIAAHFSWSSQDADPVAGRTAVTLHFQPQPGLHAHSRIERVLDSTAGDLTVDEATGQILHGDFCSLGEVQYGGGVLAHIAFRGAFAMQPAEDAWVLHDVTVAVEGRVLFSSFHGTQINTYHLAPPLTDRVP